MLGDELYLENIQEYVQDEEKIVTYKWLSRKLDVPVNTAKRMLYAYAVNCKDADPIHVTYFVSGIVGSNGDTHHEVCIVNESSLEVTKQRFSQLFSVHVYSVQKAYLKDSGVLFAADYDVTKEYIGDYSKWSTIDYPVSAKLPVKRPPCGQVPTQVAMSKFPKLSHHVKHDKEEVLAPVASVEAKSTTKVASNNESTQVSIKKNTLKGKPKVQHGKGTVASLFAKQAQKGNIGDRKEPVKVEDEPSSNSRSDTTKTTVIHITSPKKSPHKSPAKRGRPSKTKASEPPERKLTGLFKGLGDSDIEDYQSDEEPLQSKAVSKNKQRKEKMKEVSESDETISGGALQQKSDDHQQRKRKRVQELSSDEDLEESTGHRTKVESNSARKQVKRRKRYKKMVTKMFTNEDGEMVTERTMEMVSTDASEGEEKEEEVKPKPTESQVKTEKHSPAKQSSLRSFFKR